MDVGDPNIQDPHHRHRCLQEGPGADGWSCRKTVEGDVISVRKPPVTYSFRVKALTANRLGARLVPDYLENITPQSELDLLEVVKISGFIDRRKGLGRPTKREGRELSRFKEEAMDDGWDFDFDFDSDDE